MADTEVPFLNGAQAGTDEEPLAGVSDYRGRPVYRSTSGRWRSALFVVGLIGEMNTYGLDQCSGRGRQHFAFIGVSSNLITYLTGPLGQSNAAAAAAVNAWSGTASLTPLLGAFVADSWLGRYRSIILAGTLYVLGYGMMTLVSTLPAQWPVGTSTSGCPSSAKVVLFYASLYLVAVAQGPDSPCALAFAADQFDPNHPKEHAARSSLFNWWYFCFTIGVALAIGAVSYVQENLGWGIGFGMLCAIILCAFTVFLVGTPTYRLHAPTPGAANPFTLLARSLVTVVKKKADIIQYQLGIIGDEEEDSMAAKQEDAHRVLRMLSIWVSCLPYGVVFAQVMTLFNKQGRTLDRRIVGTLELPPAALQVFGPATILLFVPCYECALVPLLRCATGNPTGLTLLQRLGTGMALSLAAVSTAALVEARRLEIAREHGLADIADAVVPMSWGWLVPQYVMIGLGCVFGEVGMQEFFYDQMPGELRSLGLALYSSVIGIGSFISGILIALIDVVTRNGGGDSWFADNLNRAHLDYFYWVLAGLSAVELALFLWLASSYTYKKHIIKSLICSE